MPPPSKKSLREVKGKNPKSRNKLFHTHPFGSFTDLLSVQMVSMKDLEKFSRYQE